MKKNLSIAGVVIIVLALVGYALFIIFSSTGEPENMTLSGTYLCLPYSDNSGAQTGDCALGLKTDAGLYYALDFGAMIDPRPELKQGDRMSAYGLFVPKARINSSALEKYPVEGIFSIVSSVEKL